jgi:hypothetical protein
MAEDLPCGRRSPGRFLNQSIVVAMLSHEQDLWYRMTSNHAEPPKSCDVGDKVLTAPWVMTDLNTKIRQNGLQISPVNSGSLSEDSSSLKLLILLSSRPSWWSSGRVASSATFLAVF